MFTQKLNDWLQLGASAGIILGLLLVVVQLQQNKQLMRAEMAAGSVQHTMNNLGALQGENPAAAVAKSLQRPRELTPDELVVMNAYLRAELLMLTRETMLIDRGVFRDDLDLLAQILVANSFGSEFARAWWRATKEKGVFDPRVVVALDKALQESGRETGTGKILSDLQLHLNNTQPE